MAVHQAGPCEHYRMSRIKVGCDDQEPRSLALTRKFASGLLTLGIVIVWLVVVFLGLVVHVWNMHGAALTCPPRNGVEAQIDRGGWAEPDWCNYAGRRVHV